MLQSRRARQVQQERLLRSSILGYGKYLFGWSMANTDLTGFEAPSFSHDYQEFGVTLATYLRREPETLKLEQREARGLLHLCFMNETLAQIIIQFDSDSDAQAALLANDLKRFLFSQYSRYLVQTDEIDPIANARSGSCFLKDDKGGMIVVMFHCCLSRLLYSSAEFQELDRMAYEAEEQGRYGNN
jgi:hypothetical protein